MGSPADLAKLVQNMNRASGLIDTATSDATSGSNIMDRFEARLRLNREYMGKIDAYEKQLAAMDAVGNGGPALDDAAFPSGSPSPSPAPAAPTVTSDSSFRHDTGDPVRT